MLLEPIEIPTHCPCCSTKLELVKDQLFCRNPSCSAQLGKKLEHFAKVLGIKGLGPKTLERLQLNDLAEIFYLDVEDLTEALGSRKIAEKLLEEVEKAKTAELHVVLASFSIPLIGETASKKICAVISHIDEITEESCKKAGLGEKATNNLLTWLNTEFTEIREFLPFNYSVTNTRNISGNTGETVCITGKLTSFKTKSEAHNALEKAGYAPVDSVTKGLNYLVDEANDNSSKRKKAEQYGITIITNLQTFLQGLKHD